MQQASEQPSNREVEWTVANSLDHVEYLRRRGWHATDYQIAAHKRTGVAVAMWRSKGSK